MKCGRQDLKGLEIKSAFFICFLMKNKIFSLRHGRFSLLLQGLGRESGDILQVLTPHFFLSEDSEMAKEKDQETLEAEENYPKCGC